MCSTTPWPRSFFLIRNPDGRLSLQFRGRALPVSEAYLAHLAERDRITFEAPAGMTGSFTAGVSVSHEWATDAIEEALGAVGHDLSSTEARKRELLQWFETATSAASERSRAVA